MNKTLQGQTKKISTQQSRLKPQKGFRFFVALQGIALLSVLFFIPSCNPAPTYANEIYKITAYCACEKCCGPRAQGLTASGKKVKSGMIALNWLPFGTKVNIKGLGIYTVEDRGAKSLFGTKKNPIKHIDIYMTNHQAALNFGVKWLEVEVIR